MALGVEDPSVVITGLMGTGKSSVGREVAQRLARTFVDMDAAIEEREGRSISQIFAQRGEAYFRRLERSLCRELAAKRGLVIATGGGALISAENRMIMGRENLVISLLGELEELLARIPKNGSRPLLEGDYRRAIEALSAERREAYAENAIQIDTTGLTITQVAELIVSVVGSRTEHDGEVAVDRLAVRAPGGGYDILVGHDLLSHVGSSLAKKGFEGSVVIITNETVGPLYAPRLISSLRHAGYRSSIFMVPDGEKYKTLDTAGSLYARLLDGGIGRDSVVLALGGGVVTDLAGFVAATYMRGLALVVLPTTLVGMVDAGVGGKVGVDLPRGKNLVGVFKQPIAIICDLDALKTLPQGEFGNGYAEIVKAAIIGSPPLFERLERRGLVDIERCVREALQVKIAVVEEDPCEGGPRARLNLGHTFGHALEVVSGFTLPHGEAVSIGIAMSARLAANLGLCSPELEKRIVGCLEISRLPRSYENYEPRAVLEAMGADKKKKSQRLRFVLPVQLGQVVVTDEVRREDILRVLEEKHLR